MRNGSRRVRLNIDIFEIIMKIFNQKGKFWLVRVPCLKRWLAHNIANEVAKRCEEEIENETT